MSKHDKLVNVLMKLHFIEDSQRTVKAIRERIKQYEKRNLDRITSEHHLKFPGLEYYRVRHTDLKCLVEDDNTIETLDAYTNIIAL
jgi:hypothetical protein